jgi:hypothetical protein
VIAACLAGCIMCAALYFPARNHDEQQPIQVTGKARR